MAPSRGRGRGGALKNAPKSARGTKRTQPFRTPEDVKLDPYKELLKAERREAASTQPQERPLKRRKVAVAPTKPRPRHSSPTGSAVSNAASIQSKASVVNAQTATTDLSESEADDDEFEEVELKQAQTSLIDNVEGEEQSDAKDEPLSIVVKDEDNEPTTTRQRRGRPITGAERQARLEIHKLHVLCLIAHVFKRNHWCNDLRVQAALKKIAPTRIVQMLHPDPNASQMAASTSLTNGLVQLSSIWDNRYRISAYGMKRSYWQMSEDLNAVPRDADQEAPLGKDDFLAATKSFEGSADLGAQLFCAMLRSLGLEARLVCSLQPLPFNAAGAPPLASSAGNATKTVIYADTTTDEEDAPVGGKNRSRGPTSSVSPNKKTPIGIRRLGASKTSPGSTDQGRAPPTKKLKKMPRSAHPVYWVEVLNHAYQKWVAVDPHSTQSVGRPSKLEPALNDPENTMTYVIAFEEDGSARDVTRRYTKAFNAKTRKSRVEITPDGGHWYNRAMSLFQRRRKFDRDQVEDAELAKREASEGMPRNVQDFKNHPYYALERHLRRNEVIHPKNESGKLNVGTAMKPRMESVYRRKDVHVVRSADRWFRYGREIKEGELPLKISIPSTKQQEAAAADGEELSDEGRGLFAAFQTELYIPPPVVAGQVPKNAYGNIDVYVPSMIPPGGVHIRTAEAKYAARQLQIDYAEAVTGFRFKGRHGTAVVQGIIVAAQYKDAVETVIEGIASAREEAAENIRSVEAIKLWRAFLVGLRIKERVKGYQQPGEESEDNDTDDDEIQREMEAEMQQYEEQKQEEEGGGGFFFEPDTEGAQPTASNFVSHDYGHIGGGGFVAENQGGGFDADDGGGGFVADDHGDGFVQDSADQSRPTDVYKNDGGFLPDAVDEQSEEAKPIVSAEVDTQDMAYRQSEERSRPDDITSTANDKAIKIETDRALPDSSPKNAAQEVTKQLSSNEQDTGDAQLELAPPLVAEYLGNNANGSIQEDIRIVASHGKEDSSESDAGSLPSQDPEEEDADADWVL